MDVVFVSEGIALSLSDRAARTIGERLRKYGSGQIPLFAGDQRLMDVSTAVADAIDQAAIGVWTEPIPLEAEIAEVVYQAARMCRFEAVDHLAASALLDVLYRQRTPYQ